ncbi:MAG: glycosyltransferase family 87 protein [Gemmatimonadales bacterium]
MRFPGRLPAAALASLKRHWLLGLYIIVATGVTVQRIVLHKQNVFRIFASASRNILAGDNPYAAHPVQYFDFFRYSPAFAIAFTPFAVVPEWLGLAAWNLTNALALYWAVQRLLPRPQAQLVLVLVLGDIARTMQSCQSNGLVTALMIAAFIAYSGPRLWRGAFAVAAGTAIKIFPLGAALFALQRRDKWRALGMVAAAIALLALLPAAFIGPHSLLLQYGRWAAQEHAETFKPMSSVMDLLDVWIGYYGPRFPVQLVGLAILMVPAIAGESRDDPAWRLRLLSSLLIFSVLFNYGAERPGFVIATTGIAIWYVTGPRTTLRSVLILLTLALVTGDGVGLWPPGIRDWMNESRIRVIPVLASWIAIQWDLLSPRAVPATEPVTVFRSA